MRLALRQVELWLPVLVVLVVVAGISVSVGDELAPGPGVQDVDVKIVDAGDVRTPLPRGEAVSGSVDEAVVGVQGFTFTGWADFRAGASLLLRTSGTGIGPRIRARSLPRPDVAAALDEPGALYSGYTFSGTAADLGAVTCLVLLDEDGSRVLWEASPGICR